MKPQSDYEQDMCEIAYTPIENGEDDGGKWVIGMLQTDDAINYTKEPVAFIYTIQKEIDGKLMQFTQIRLTIDEIVMFLSMARKAFK